MCIHCIDFHSIIGNWNTNTFGSQNILRVAVFLIPRLSWKGGFGILVGLAGWIWTVDSDPGHIGERGTAFSIVSENCYKSLVLDLINFK